MSRWCGKPRNPTTKTVRKLLARGRPKVGAIYAVLVYAVKPSEGQGGRALCVVQRVSKREVVVTFRSWMWGLYGEYTLSLAVFNANAWPTRKEYSIDPGFRRGAVRRLRAAGVPVVVRGSGGDKHREKP